MATLGTEESDHYEEVAVVNRLKQEWMYDNVIAVVERWPISGPVQLYLNYNKAWAYSFLFLKMIRCFHYKKWQRQRDTVQLPPTYSWFRVLILLDLPPTSYLTSSGFS